MKEFLVTTGLAVAYMGTFEVCLFNLQAPARDSVPLDYSSEYYNRITSMRKLQSKSKGKDASLAQIIKTLQLGGAQAAAGAGTPGSAAGAAGAETPGPEFVTQQLAKQ